MSRRNKGKFPVRPAGELKMQDIQAILERTKVALSAEEHAKLTAAIETLAFLTAQLQAKNASIGRLRALLFGAKSEKTEEVLGRTADADPGPHPDARAPTEVTKDGSQERAKRKGHGRNGAAAFTGAERIKVAHPSLTAAQQCPACTGKVYALSEPAKLVRITGMGPLSATVYECERLRCNLCGQVYTAAAPAGVGEEKYDESATAMVALLKYGAGLPFNRIEKLQAGMGIPLPAATQWDLVKSGAQTVASVHEGLIDQAAQGQVLHNDDTTMKVLELTREQRAAALGEDAEEERTGVFTSGILATGAGHKIALFFTGARYAGENLTEVLKRRAADLTEPIHMCDGLLSRNVPDDRFETLLAQCLVHGRRNFVKVADAFPEEVRFVLENLRAVYKTDARARKDNLTPEERLRLHQEESAPRMKALQEWMAAQFTMRKVEPNSTLGDAIKYMQKRWEALTLFLRVAGAPLDNNLCEQVLKKAILHRKNALFYKTLNGASVGDRFMSLIHTAELAGVNAFDYLVTLMRHREHVAANPAAWMPWNYQATAVAISLA